MTSELDEQTPGTSNPAHDLEQVRTSVVQRASGALRSVRTGATALGRRLPGTVHASGTAGQQATAALQRLPDSTLRWIAASSVGLAAGLRIAGAPRLVTAAGAAPALLMGAAIALRPTEPGVTVQDPADGSALGLPDMTDEHLKGSVTRAQGTVEEGLGKLTGDKERQLHGKVKRAQGNAQEALGDIQDAVAEPKHQAKEGA